MTVPYFEQGTHFSNTANFFGADLHDWVILISFHFIFLNIFVLFHFILRYFICELLIFTNKLEVWCRVCVLLSSVFSETLMNQLYYYRSKKYWINITVHLNWNLNWSNRENSASYYLSPEHFLRSGSFSKLPLYTLFLNGPLQEEES